MLKVKRLRDGAKLPTRAYDSALAYDVYYCPLRGNNIVNVAQNSPSCVHTGIAIQPPEGYGYFVKERGSLGSKGLAIRAGVVDEDYRGELMVFMQNLSNVKHTFNPGDKIAQIILVPTPTAEVVEVNELEETKRGAKMLGSSGR